MKGWSWVAKHHGEEAGRGGRPNSKYLWVVFSVLFLNLLPLSSTSEIHAVTGTGGGNTLIRQTYKAN